MSNRVAPEAAASRRKQKYSKLKANCVKKNSLFEDPTFPPVGSSLFHSKEAPDDIVWQRPKDIVRDPKFFIGSAGAEDFAQGSLGNCWFVAACACISKDKDLWKKIVPEYWKQEWAPGNEYAGIFHFKFWRCGEWEDVVIDDYLPTRSGKLIYTHSKTEKEFWSALLEKAFAKLYGSYEALAGGTARDAMVDMTGGVGEGLDVGDFKTEEKKMKLFEILKKAMDNKSLMCASFETKPSESVGLIEGHEYSMTGLRNIQLKGTGLFGLFNKEKIQMIRLRNPWGQGEWKGAWSDGIIAILCFTWSVKRWKLRKEHLKIQTKPSESVGLIEGHEYSMTGLRNIQLKGTGLFGLFNKEKIQMIRLRNPWGQGEWKGAWSDGSPEWQKVDEKNKKNLGLTFDNDGEFWMSFEDFCEYFTKIDICHMINTSLFTMKKTWNVSDDIGEWKSPLRAGGCQNDDTFLQNPQYLFEVSDDEEEVMISLEQEDRRAVGQDPFSIGVTILKTDVNRKYRMHDKMGCVHDSPFVQARSIFTRFPLKKGQYLLVPSTFDPGQEGRYVLRIFTDDDAKLKELKLDEPKPPGCLGSPYVSATVINISNVDELKNKDGEMKAYCVVKCEGKKIETTTSKKSLTPTWEDRVTLYRKKPKTDIIVEMWKDNILKDSLVGLVTLTEESGESEESDNKQRYELMKIGKDKTWMSTGFLFLSVRHTTNLSEV